MQSPKRSTVHVGVLVDTEDSWGRNIVESVCRFAQSHEWTLLLSPRDRHGKLRIPNGWQGHGVVAALRNRALVRHVRELGVSVVDVSSASKREKWFGRIQTDDSARAKMAVEHLVERGVQHFACYAPSIGRYSDQRAREIQAYVSGIGYRCDTYTSKPGQQWLTNHRDVRRWLKKLPKPVGIFAGDPYPARQLVEVCMMNSIRVPDEVAIIAGDDDDLLCHIATPQISSIELASHRIGEAAAKLLKRLMKGAAVPQKPTLIPPIRIRARQSTDLFAIDDDSLKVALRFIREHAATNMGVTDVASACHISRRLLEQKFRTHLECSPAEAIRKTRLEHVRRLLHDTEKTVTAIALECDFSSTASLCQAFQKHFGQSPGQFRSNRK
ncbi:AraC family transcriptional regulator [Neorhodopirellula pilleata]|uniref:Xylose operon regulatory protein n=1 Tax=Neorhodopirellula pilleata TaxID=2714738 RepID=A0A5C6ATN9_9BACT|nr:XylR family transcriptional regulator [Neorhodopirellula pilleata]TWU03403.1 Xylose operon regulatory protein [Neorhodopirellula pilleata]